VVLKKRISRHGKKKRAIVKERFRAVRGEGLGASGESEGCVGNRTLNKDGLAVAQQGEKKKKKRSCVGGSRGGQSPFLLLLPDRILGAMGEKAKGRILSCREVSCCGRLR